MPTKWASFTPVSATIRNFQLDFHDPWLVVILPILSYAFLVISMRSRNTETVGAGRRKESKLIFSEWCSKSSRTQRKTQRLLRTILLGRAYVSDVSGEGDTESSRNILSREDSLPKNRPFHSPGTGKKFRCTAFFSKEPKLLLAAPALFARLREEVFDLPPETYYDKNLSVSNTDAETTITPSQDTLGFSGSQFYFTHDKALIVKSVPRGFESSFLLQQMLDAYTVHIMRCYRISGTAEDDTRTEFAYSLLTPITDVLYPPCYNLLGMLGIGGEGGVWIVMKNSLLLSPHDEPERGIKASTKWDLKPPSFFEPTRDLVPDRLKTSAVKSGLADAHIPLKDCPVVTAEKKAELLSVLKRDTRFLSTMHAVDYSILLGRWKRSEFLHDLGRQQWSEGILSKDGKWVYRIAVVDFLWSQRGGVRPMLTKTAGKAVPEQTISTEPDRYMEAVLGMCKEWVLTEEPRDEEVEGAREDGER